MAGSRDWAGLAAGPAGIIADRVLSYDVADYVRFRAVCCPWRQSSADPHAHGVMDRRFHPWRWTMLREEHAAPSRRSFLNTSTGECIQVDIPELLDHDVLAVTAEGLLVLLHRPQCTDVRLLNPLTRQLLADLPPITTLLPPLPGIGIFNYFFDIFRQCTAWGSGIAGDDSTVVLSFNRLGMLGTAKPGDDHWTPVYYDGYSLGTAPVMLAGRFYCVTVKGVMVLEMGGDEPPRLVVAANLNMPARPFEDCMHLVNNCGELLLIHRQSVTQPSGSSIWRERYDTYRVDLDNEGLFRVKSLGGGTGRAVFMGADGSLSVSLDVFPSGSISADTIYLSFDFGEREFLNIGSYHLRFGCVGRASRRWGGLVPCPHTLVDCLCLANTVKYTV
ncbi:hypothetical protein CFC21_050571 [Triticum aestivum]|uniref:KIB1-4 beta-propeller domain-containing protein n=2 Tax=Triticum aestivum TaxID=4565 RepID=A0A3B6H4E3_WHEAT|nr:hypothetical protein CFC21_050571 [Triticum aestivum]